MKGATISGGAGGSGGPAGMGIDNAGTLGPVNNAGTIDPGAGAFAILSTGSIGPITNSGKIIGNVEIDDQASVSITGGSGETFGSWTGGTITIGAGNLTFAGGSKQCVDRRRTLCRHRRRRLDLQRRVQPRLGLWRRRARLGSLEHPRTVNLGLARDRFLGLAGWGFARRRGQLLLREFGPQSAPRRNSWR